MLDVRSKVRSTALRFRHNLSASLLAALLCLTFPAISAVASAPSCQLASPHANIQHVIYIQFDGVHFTRDNPNVPSDLEQMPHLLNFIRNNGALLTNHHSVLIAHEATDVLTAVTGVYPDGHGMPISNSFRYFNPNGTSNPAASLKHGESDGHDLQHADRRG